MRIDEFAEKGEEERNKELGDCKISFYYELDTLPILSEGKENSPPESPKSPTVTKLQEVQIESHSEGP